MKLELHLVPESSFASNLRKQLGARWSALSRRIRGEHDWKCQLCGWKENRPSSLFTHLHEVWEYNDDTHVQKLTGFECVCPDCHAVHHWGRSQISRKDMDVLTKHACRVNNCTEAEWDKHVEEASALWNTRSGHQWKIEMEDWESLADPISKATNITWV